MLISPSTIFN